MTTIIDIQAREILDSRGNPTVEADVILESGAMGRAAVPSGASTGVNEAVELRDGVKKRYLGKGVQNAVKNIENKIMPELLGRDATDRGRRGLRHARARWHRHQGQTRGQCRARCVPRHRQGWGQCTRATTLQIHRRPKRQGATVPMANVINGGAHSDAPIDFQEFMIMPKGLPTFSEGLRAITEIFHALKGVLKKRGLSTAVGEGGFAPQLDSTEDAIECILAATKAAGYKAGKQIYLALDVASSEFYDSKKKRYIFKKSDGSKMSADQIVAFYDELTSKYPIIVSRTAAMKMTGPAGKSSPTRSATACNSWATTCS